jgi:predicted branched-subunit amino acid permease
VCFQITWAGSVTIIGALTGSFIPESVVGLNFALTAFFLVLCIDKCRTRKNLPVPLVAL